MKLAALLLCGGWTNFDVVIHLLDCDDMEVGKRAYSKQMFVGSLAATEVSEKAIDMHDVQGLIGALDSDIHCGF